MMGAFHGDVRSFRHITGKGCGPSAAKIRNSTPECQGAVLVIGNPHIFQPKEDGKGLINLDVAESFFYISNDEYIIAVVDAENRILAGIKYDAQPYFPNHEMYSVITNEEWLYAIIDAENKVLGGFRVNDGHMIVGGIDISTFIANAIIDRLIHHSTIVKITGKSYRIKDKLIDIDQQTKNFEPLNP